MLVRNMNLRLVLHLNRRLMSIHHFLIMNLDLPTMDLDNSGIPTTLLVSPMVNSSKRREHLEYYLI
jgi:hypothetical protein